MREIRKALKTLACEAPDKYTLLDDKQKRKYSEKLENHLDDMASHGWHSGLVNIHILFNIEYDTPDMYKFLKEECGDTFVDYEWPQLKVSWA